MTDCMNGLIGTVCVCSEGIAGLVVGVANLPWGKSFVGFRQDNGRAWASRNPRPTAQRPSIEARYAHRRSVPWSVDVVGEQWVLTWGGKQHPITSAEAPQGIAIDAACEFMDRAWDHDVPTFINDDAELMQFCVTKAWRQR